MIGASMDASTIRELALQISGIDTIVALSTASGTSAASGTAGEIPSTGEAPAVDREIPSVRTVRDPLVDESVEFGLAGTASE